MTQTFGIPGLFTTGMSAGDFFVNDAARDILQSYPGMNGTLFALTSAMPSQKVDSKIFEWKDEVMGFPIFSCEANANTSGAPSETLKITGNPGVFKMCVITNTTTGEDMYVTAQDGNTLTVIRGFAGTTVKAVTETDQFLQLAQATPEASYLPPSKVFHTTFFKNYIQKIVSTTELDEDALKEKTKEGYNPEKYIKDRTVDDHAMQVERALMFGRKSETIIRDQDGQDKKLYTTDGLMAQIKTNRVAIPNGFVTLDAIIEAFSACQEYTVKGVSNAGHMAFVSQAFLRRLNSLIRSDKSSSYDLSFGTAEWGIKVARLETGAGVINMIPYRLFDELVAYRGTAVIFNPALLSTMYFEKTNVRNFKVPKFTVLNAMVTQMGLRVRQEHCHAVVTGLLGSSSP